MFTGSYGKLETNTAIVTINEKTVEVESVELDKITAEVNVGETIDLKATVKPDGATNKKLTWKSSDTKLATVTQTGKVKGVSEGEVKVTATSSNGKTAECTVTVNVPKPEPDPNTDTE